MWIQFDEAEDYNFRTQSPKGFIKTIVIKTEDVVRIDSHTTAKNGQLIEFYKVTTNCPTSNSIDSDQPFEFIIFKKEFKKLTDALFEKEKNETKYTKGNEKGYVD